MDRTKLNIVIQNKRERNQQLITQIKFLELVEKELSKTKLKRFFSTTYLIIKRYTLILLSLLLIFTGLLIYTNTQWVYNHTEIDEYLVKNIHNKYKEIASKAFVETLDNLKNTSKVTPTSLFESALIGIGIDNVFEDEVYKVIISISIVSIIIGVLLLYISRLTKKIRIRNKQISESENKIELILKEFKNILNSEKEELTKLEEIYENRIVGEESRRYN
ncbi:hypothetical protein ACQY1Q_14740 [Tenacibaculum sp. TC6]|uniref:hypothetical protein n=1 Tax=Tenacibaculum sp. TC6 TaxID=3423223 RepID=UPI003D360249